MSTVSAVPTVRRGLAIRRFAVHLFEMCASMCIGGIALDALVFGAIGLWAPTDSVARYPELSIVIIAIDATFVMASYMALRGHPSRHNVEMSAASIVGGIA